MLSVPSRTTTVVPASGGFEPVQIRSLFPSPLVVAALAAGAEAEALVSSLRRLTLVREREVPGVVHSNDGGWQSDTDLLTWAGREGEALVAATARLIDSLTARFDGTQLCRLAVDWEVTAWANVSRFGAANEAHHHAGGYWSAIFYVDDGGSDEVVGGAVEFLDPRGPLPMANAPDLKMTIENCLTAGLVERVYPLTGMLLLFPSWLIHRVTRYAGSGVRMSIAMNFARRA